MTEEISISNNNFTTLHITFSPVVAGSLFHTLSIMRLKHEIAIFPLNVSCYGMPNSLETYA